LTELKLTMIRIEVLTPDRLQAHNIVKAVTPLLIDMTLPNPKAWVDIHVCPEEPEEAATRDD